MTLKPDRILLARMTETSDGMFKAEYTGEMNPDNRDYRGMPDIHPGSEAAVRFWVEEMANGMGYANVEWEDRRPD